jgi:hypothetical protein
MNNGDLVWLPASTSLLQFDDDGAVCRHKNTKRPLNVLVVARHDYAYWKILYEGEQWCVPDNLLFPALKEE